MGTSKKLITSRDFDARVAAQWSVINKGRIFIGLCGRAQHGKSSLAASLLSHFSNRDRNCISTAFATVPKKMLLTMGLNSAQLWGDKKAERSDKLGMKTPRFAMQSLATEWGRKMLYDEIWIDAWLREVNANVNAEIILIEDVRHGPEIEQLRELGAILVEVYRPALMPKTWLGWGLYWLKQLRAHSSEKLDFQKMGIPRIVVEEGKLELTLEKFLSMHPQLR